MIKVTIKDAYAKSSILHFTYWLQEHKLRPDVAEYWNNDTPILRKFEVLNKLHNEFIRKYPNELLTGWSDNKIYKKINNIIKQDESKSKS